MRVHIEYKIDYYLLTHEVLRGTILSVHLGPVHPGRIIVLHHRLGFRRLLLIECEYLLMSIPGRPDFQCFGARPHVRVHLRQRCVVRPLRISEYP